MKLFKSVNLFLDRKKLKDFTKELYMEANE